MALAKALMSEKDKLIASAINDAMCGAAWDIPTIAPRLKHMIDEKTLVSMWTLDNEPLIEIWPFELMPANEEGSWKIIGSFHFFIYPRTGGSS